MSLTDTRLIQTAVLGSRSSDQPVILPQEAHNLDEFRRRYHADRFWCGTLLGGCGEELTTKRYTGKVCHFSHLPDLSGSARVCHRAANGTESADHLFVKKHVLDWLEIQGHAAHAELRTFGSGPGDAVDFWLRATDQHLRFELRPEDYLSWRKAAESLSAREGHVEWVIGAEGPITADIVARQGYALRARCTTVDEDRSVLIGTATEKDTVWEPLSECRMTPDGILTPTLQGLQAQGTVRRGGMRNDPLPVGLPLRGADIVFAVDSEAVPPAGSPFTADRRYLVSGFLRPAGSRIVRASLSLPDDVPRPTEQFVYRLSGSVRLLVTDPMGRAESHWTVQANALIRLNGIEAERTGLWRPDVALDEAVGRSQPPKEMGPESAPSRGAEPRRSAAAEALRQELCRVAARSATATWKELATSAGLDLTHLSEPRCRELLVEVDRPYRPDVPLLSVLVRDRSRRPLSYLGTVLRMLGAQAPTSDRALNRWIVQEIERTHQAHEPTRTPVSQTAHRSTPSEADLGSAQRQATRLRSKVSEAALILERTTGRRAERLRNSVNEANSHLEKYGAASASGRSLRKWITGCAPLLDGLERLVGHEIVSTPADTCPTEPSRAPQSAPDGHQETSLARTPILTPGTALDRINAVLDPLLQQGEAAGSLALRSGLSHARILKRHVRGGLPDETKAKFDALERMLALNSTDPADAGEADGVASASGSVPPYPATVEVASPADAQSSNPATVVDDHPPSGPSNASRLPLDIIDRLASRVRAVLADIARFGGKPITWGELRRRMHGDLPYLCPDDQGELLVAVDRDTPSEEPLLSTLIAGKDSSQHWLYRHVRYSLHRERIPEEDLETHWATEALRLRQVWRYR